MKISMTGQAHILYSSSHSLIQVYKHWFIDTILHLLRNTTQEGIVFSVLYMVEVYVDCNCNCFWPLSNSLVSYWHIKIYTSKGQASSPRNLWILAFDDLNLRLKLITFTLFLKLKNTSVHECKAKKMQLSPPGQVYASIIGICACNYAAMPLFFEVAVDIAFPVSDIPVTGMMTAADCLASTVFLTIYSIPNVGKTKYLIFKEEK